jgi:hypothetical protein
MAAYSIGGTSLLAVRVGESNIASNKDMTKRMEISVNGEVVDSIPVGICLRGDANSDGSADVFDAITIAKYTVGTLGDSNFKGSMGEFAGNVNEDSSLDVFDAISIAKFTVCGESDAGKAWKKVLGK